MHIPKSKMPMLIKELDLLLSIDEDRPEGAEELIKQIHDRASLVLQGDANFLTVEAYYGHKPEQGI